MKKIGKYIIFFLLPAIIFPLFLKAKGSEFVENKGQWSKNIYARAPLKMGYMYLEYDKITVSLMDLSPLYKLHTHPGDPKLSTNPVCKGNAYTINFLNALKPKDVEPEEKRHEYYNFYLGNDKNKWASHVNAYGKYILKNIYQNVNFIALANGLKYKFEFEVEQGGDYKNIQLEYKGVSPKIDKDGDLVLDTHVGKVTEFIPKAWQVINGEKQPVKCEYKLRHNVVSFKIKDKINEKYPLVIDPVLKFCSYSGSYADNFGMSATYDANGDLYAGGTAFNIGYPTTIGAYDTTFFGPAATGITDVVISKYDSSGHFMQYSTYIGGSQAETVHSMIVNQQNQLYIFGLTGSANFPTTANAFDTTFNGGTYLFFAYNGTKFNNGTDIYIAKFNSTGTALLASTFVGGSKNDGANCVDNTSYTNIQIDSLQHNYSDQYRGEINLDKNGDVYVGSCTKSADFPTVNAYQDSLRGGQDAVAFKMSANLSTMIWSTYLGGLKKDAAYSIKVDSSLNAYVAGGTCSHDFPVTAGAYSTTFNGGTCDGFVSKIGPNGNVLVHSTYLGTSDYDQCFFVSIDRWNNAYVVGQSAGSFPVSSGVYSNSGSGQFIAKLNSNFSALDYSTVFGSGNGIDLSPAAFLVDYCGNVYVSGWGKSLVPYPPVAITGMPVTANAFQPNSHGTDFYLAVFSRNLTNLIYATYFGGSQSPEHVDGGTSRFDKDGVIYQSICAGCWANSDLPTTPGAWSNTNNSSGCNNGVFKFDFQLMPSAKFTASDTTGCAPFTIQFHNSSPPSTTYKWIFGDGSTSTQQDPMKTYSDTGTYIVKLAIRDTICGFVDTVEKTVIVIPQLHLSTSNDTSLCNPANLTFTAYTDNTADTFIWSSDNNFTDTLNQNIYDSTFTFFCNSSKIFYVKVENKYCSKIDSVQVHSHIIAIEPKDTSICFTNQAVIHAGFTGDTTGLLINWSPQDSIISGIHSDSPEVIARNGNNFYYVTATNSFGCSTTDTLQLYYNDTADWNVYASAHPDTIVNGDTSHLDASPSNDYVFSWTPSASLDDAQSSSTTAHPNKTTTYRVAVTDSNGCSVYRYVTVYVREISCKAPDIFVPDAFTPNGDKKNDVLYVRGDKYIRKMYFTIYDRWGEKVFETNDINKGWDGTYKGKKLKPAVYDYYLKATCLDGQHYFKKGNITLIR